MIERVRIPKEAPPSNERVRLPKAKGIVHHHVRCAFCKHFYLSPCDDKRKEGCPNYLHIAGSKKSKRRK